MSDPYTPTDDPVVHPSVASHAPQPATSVTAPADMDMDDLIQKGDFSSLTMRERSVFVYNLSKRLGLNPLTKPFDFIVLNNKLTLYANRTCSDQLRKLHNLTTTVLYEGPLMLGQTQRDDVYVVKVRIMAPPDDKGYSRFEEHGGSVGIDGLKGEAFANATMKCSTKAIRRATMAFCGLGLLDEIEVDSAKNLEGGVGAPRRIVPEEPATPPPAIFPTVEAKPVAAPAQQRPLPQAAPPSSQPVPPKLPTVLPAVKP